MRHSHASQTSDGQAKAMEQERRLVFSKISELKNLPSPSPAIMATMALLRDKEVDIRKLVEAIERDQSLVARLLKMVNSSFYVLRSTVDSVGRAAAMLGLENIKRLVYSAAMMEFFAKDQQLEWEHSYSSSALMGALIKDNRIEGVSSLPLAMILHDIGKVVLRRHCAGKYNFTAMLAAKAGSSLAELESQFLHVNHAEAGAMLLKKWDVPESITIPILQHHMAKAPYEYVLETALVQFVNWVDCQARGMPCLEPSQPLLDAAGIEISDTGFWIDCQAKLIEGLKDGTATARTIGGTAGKLKIGQAFRGGGQHAATPDSQPFA